jgi:N-acetylglucosamine-6-sulfatase
MVASLDIAPTMLEAAGVPSRQSMHGQSLVPLMAGRKTPWREELLIEYNSDRVFPRIRNMGYRALRTNRWKYIEYRDLAGANELYDLKSDPFELNNVIAESTELPRLRTRLANLERKFA